MKRRIAAVVLIAMLAVTCMSMTCACVKDEEPPRKVEIEVLNPNTGEPIKRNETIEMPRDNTPVVIKIKDKETGEYLTDDDLPENTISGSCYLTFFVLSYEGAQIEQRTLKIRENLKGYWPTKEELERWSRPFYNYYKIAVSFDCRPDNPQNPDKYERRYAMTTQYIRFYINKE